MSKNIEGFGEVLRREGKRMEEFNRSLLEQSKRDTRNTLIGGFVFIAAMFAVSAFFLFR